MERIICDICGSEYPQTEQRCPVCSYPRQGNEKLAAAASDAGAQRVKGGRFSEKNVKKRRRSQKPSDAQRDPNKPLLIVIALLLAAIALVSAYIAMRFFQGRGAYQPNRDPVQTTVPTETTQPPEVACTAILLERSVLELEEGELQIGMTLLPEDTTDVPAFTVDREDVVTVSETGLLTAVGPGTAVVTITCGDAVKECTVICTMEGETDASIPEGELTLDKADMSFFNPGESYTLRAMVGDTEVDVIWTSGDSLIATVENGHVTAVGNGTVTITAEYGGQSAECVVRCQFGEE